MSDEYDNNKSYQAQSSEVLDGSAGSINPDMDYVRPAEIPEQDYATWLGEQETFADLIAKQQDLVIGDTKLAKK